MINILISQIDEHNESNILATKEFNPEVVYLIKDKSYEDKVDTLKNYYENNFKNVKLELFNVEEGNNKALEKIIDNVKDKNIIVNLTGGKRVNSLILLDICLKMKIKALYIDIKKKVMYEFNNNDILISSKSFGI